MNGSHKRCAKTGSDERNPSTTGWRDDGILDFTELSPPRFLMFLDMKYVWSKNAGRTGHRIWG